MCSPVSIEGTTFTDVWTLYFVKPRPTRRTSLSIERGAIPNDDLRYAPYQEFDMSEALKTTDQPRDSNPATVPLDRIEIWQPHRFENYTFWPYFERLRKEDPVHYTAESPYGPFWSITQVRRHHVRRHASRHFLLRGRHHRSTTIRKISRCRCSSRWIRPSTICSARR